MSPDPYASSDEPPAAPVLDRVIAGLRTVNSTMNLVIGGVFALVGVGLLIGAAITHEAFLLPAAIFAFVIGAVRFLLGRRQRLG